MNWYKKFGILVTGTPVGDVRLGLGFSEFLYDGPEIRHTVTLEEEGRPDLISWKYYDTPFMTRVILDRNGIADALLMKANTELFLPIPSAVDLDKNYRPSTYLGTA